MREYRGVDVPKIEEFWFDFNSFKGHGTKEDHQWMWAEGVKLGLFRYGHVTTGAIVGVRKLAEQGHKLSVVTHRPAAAVQDTLDWLSYVRLPFTGVHILSNQEPKTTVDWDLLIDDKPENIKQAEFEGRVGVLFDQPWNKDVDFMPIRAQGWRYTVGAVEYFDDKLRPR